MAYIYGSAAQGSVRSRRKDILLRLVLPLLFVLILAGVALFAFKQEQYWLTAIFAVFFVASVLRFEELGLTVSHYLSHSQTNARAGQVVAKALEHLPNEYHVFHDLHFDGGRIDHAVIGPNGLFLLRTSSHLGNISASGESLRLNGWPFLLDMLTGCWNQTQKLTKHLGLHYSGGLRPCPVLCFSRASVRIIGPVRGALVVEAGNLAQAILGHEDSLLTDKMLLLIDKFSELVSVKTKSPVCTKGESQACFATPQAFPPKSNLPVCAKCDHQATEQEFELFPGECPRCGRLYSFVPDESSETPDARRLKTAWRPTIPQLSMTVLLIAGCAGYIAHRQGFLAEDQFSSSGTAQTPPVIATAKTTVGNASASPEVETLRENAQQASLALTAGDDAAPLPASLHGGTAEPVLPVSASGANASPTAGESVDAGLGDIAVVSNDATLPGGDGQNSTMTEKEDAAVLAAASPKAVEGASKVPAKSFAHGRLSVTSPCPLIMWLRHQQTYKEFGPFEVRAGRVSEIMLPKGFYNVVYLENGKRRQTTMSFLSDQGRLEF
jgi:hypothetical protein